MRVLVTRRLEDSLRTAQELAKLGHTAIIAPLFDTRILDGPELKLEDVQAILATSSNGVRAFARRCAQRDLPVFAVGTQTAATAHAAGFAAVVNARGDARMLAAAASAQLRPQAGALLHAAGANSTNEIAGALTGEGFEVRHCVLYETVEAQELPSAAAEALGAGMLDAMIVYSPRSARVFSDRVRHAGLGGSCTGVLACCISKQTAEALAGVAFRAVRVAAHPDQDSLLALLERPTICP